MARIARRDDQVLIERLDEASLVIYDERSQTAHALDGAAVQIWDALDGQRTRSELAQACNLDEQVVRELVERLEALDLLEPVPGSGVSRRAMLGRAARIGGVTALTASLITSVAVPAAAAVNSACGAGAGNACVLAYTNARCLGAPVSDACTAAWGAPCRCVATSGCVTGLNQTSTQSGTCGV